MDAQWVIERLQSVAIQAVRAQEDINSGDSLECWDKIEGIEADLLQVKNELEKLFKGKD